MNKIIVWSPFEAAESFQERCMVGHEGSIFFVSFAPSNASAETFALASGSDDRSIRLWHWQKGDAQTAREVLWGHSHRPWRAAWSPEGDVLVTVGEDNKICSWHIQRQSGRLARESHLISTREGHDGKGIWSVAITPDGAQVLTGGADGAVQRWPTKLSEATTYDVPNGISDALYINDDLYVVDKTGALLSFSTGDRTAKTINSPATRSAQTLLRQVRRPNKLDTLLLLTRSGCVTEVALDGGVVSHTQQTGLRIQLAETRTNKGTPYCAIYNSKTDRLVLALLADFQQNDDACLSIVSSSDVVDAHRMPSFLQWVDDDAIVICDPRGRVTLFTVMHSAITQTRQFNAFTSNVLPEVFSMVALRAADTSITLYIGEADQCTVFALREDAIRPPVLTREQELCHDHGRARQIALHKGRPLFLCSGRNTCVLADDTGRRLASFTAPKSAVHTAQLIVSSGSTVIQCREQDRLHEFEIQLDSPNEIQEGLHGTLIRCVALTQLPTVIDDDVTLLASGSEDGTLKISVLSSQNLRHTVLFRDPTLDGAVQNVKWSLSTLAPRETLLFVTGAKGTLHCLRVAVTPDAKSVDRRIKVRRLACASPHGESDAESRIMTVDVLRRSDESSRHTLLCGYSSGELRLWDFDESQSEFSAVFQTTWHERCILAVKLLHVEDPTQQYIAQFVALSAATDGRLAVWRLVNTAHGWQCGQIRSIKELHQSGINCLDARNIDGICHVLTGGDDGDLVYTFFSLYDDKPAAIARSSGAHSSSLKGVSFSNDMTRCVSTSTDQRLSIWNVEPDKLSRADSAVTEVADVACLDVLHTTGDHFQGSLAAVSGMGLELVEIADDRGSSWGE